MVTNNSKQPSNLSSKGKHLKILLVMHLLLPLMEEEGCRLHHFCSLDHLLLEVNPSACLPNM
jgi:hypothetical protein